MKKNYFLLLCLLFVAVFSFALEAEAKTVYYSAGQNILDHKTGTPTVTISNGIATFSVAQTAENMGVGDRVTYNGSKKAFIAAKISDTIWQVVTVKGAVPANITNATVNSIRHEFDSLNSAVGYYPNNRSAIGDSNHLGNGNLVSGNYVVNIPLYYDTGPEYFTGNGIYSGILLSNADLNTGPNNYIRIYTPTNTISEVNVSQRHDGKWNDQKYNLIFTPDNNSTAAIRTYVPYIKIDGLQIKIISSNDNSLGIEASYIDNGWVEVSNNIITGQISNFATGISMGYGNADLVGKIWNNLIYDLRGGSGISKGIEFGICYGSCGTGTGYIYNNTIVNVGRGIDSNSGEATIVAKDNIVQDADIGYDGNFSSSDYNISDKNDAPGNNSINAVVSFANKSGKDFHLSPSDISAKDGGVNLLSDPDLSISTDYESDSRPSGNGWDIGADEIYAAPQGNITINATLDGSPWTGSVVYNLTGPENLNGTSVPNTFINKTADGTYTLSYVSDGPVGAELDSITPVSSQYLPPDSAIAFTLNFRKVSITIVATNIFCKEETDLPNWSFSGKTIDSTTASEFLDSHPQCSPAPGWDFQWAPADASALQGDFLGSAGSPWTSFGPTDNNGVAQTTIDAGQAKGGRFWIREALKPGFQNFTAPPENPPNDVSAEMWCWRDVEFYDNFDLVDFQNYPLPGDIYNCVAFNTKSKQSMEDYSLSADPAGIFANVRGNGNLDSSKTKITVTSFNGFSRNITLSSNISSIIPGGTDTFTRQILDKNHYSDGSDFYVTIPANTVPGSYVITIQGDDGVMSPRTTTVTLNVERIDTEFKEVLTPIILAFAK